MPEGNASCKYFEAEFLDADIEKTIAISDDRFISLICIAGQGAIGADNFILDVNAGDSIFVPAQRGALKITGNLKIAKSFV